MTTEKSARRRLEREWVYSTGVSLFLPELSPALLLLHTSSCSCDDRYPRPLSFSLLPSHAHYFLLSFSFLFFLSDVHFHPQEPRHHSLSRRSTMTIPLNPLSTQALPFHHRFLSSPCPTAMSSSERTATHSSPCMLALHFTPHSPHSFSCR